MTSAYGIYTSIVGWYIGSYLERFVPLGMSDCADPEQKFASRICTVLVRAPAMKEAYDKIIDVALEKTPPVIVTHKKREGRWAFEGITGVLPVYEDIEDGAEVTWAEYKPRRKLKNLRKMIRSGEALSSQHTTASSTGWYIGNYLLRFIELDDRHNDDPERHFLAWENTIIVKAENANAAYERMIEVAAGETAPYRGGTDGVPVQWVLEGVTELWPVNEEIADGAEVTCVETLPRKLKNLRHQVYSWENWETLLSSHTIVQA